jgi:hypothetical protein
MPESPLIGSLNSDALATFDEVLRILGHADWDLSPCDITHVEAFWSANSFDVAAAGFVLRLRGGRRTYLDVWIERALEEDAPPAKVEIELATLPPGQRYPHFPSDADPVGGWQDDIEPLNALLRRVYPD